MAKPQLEAEDHKRDAAFNKALHGTTATGRGGLFAMAGKNRAAQQAAVDEYFKHWDSKAAVDETEETREVKDILWFQLFAHTDIYRLGAPSIPR